MSKAIALAIPLGDVAKGVEKQASGKKASDPETDPGELAAVDDLAAALGIEVKDREGAAAALRDFVRICSAKDYGSGEEESEGE